MKLRIRERNRGEFVVEREDAMGYWYVTNGSVPLQTVFQAESWIEQYSMNAKEEEAFKRRVKEGKDIVKEMEIEL